MSVLLRGLSLILIYPYFTQLPKAISSDFMISALTYSSSHLFADDVQIYVSSPDLWPPEPYFFFNFLNFILFNFTILYWFCHISKWICHRYTCVPHPEPSSLLPPHTIPLGLPSAPAPSIQYHASNLDWRLVSYMILYIFQCHFPKSSHPLPLPQSPKDHIFQWILRHLCLYSLKSLQPQYVQNQTYFRALIFLLLSCF